MDLHTKVTLTRKQFLSNEKNKIELIKHLSKAFTFEHFSIKQAEEDADSLIINTAIEIAKINNKNVVVVAEDIDLLVLLNQLNSTDANIYFLKPGVGNVIDAAYTSNSFKEEKCRSIIAFLHCFSGCNTTSGFAGKEKTVADPIISTSNLLELVKPFYEPNATPNAIATNGCATISSIYKCKNSTISLDDLRFQRYKVLTAKNTFKLENLPLTVGGGTQHSYRVYFQIQTWCVIIILAMGAKFYLWRLFEDQQVTLCPENKLQQNFLITILSFS